MNDAIATTETEPSGGRRAFLAGVFLVSFSALGIEVLFTRLLSVLTWYSFAFLVIGMGMFGLTAGAVVVYLRPRPRCTGDVLGALSADAIRFAIAVPISYALLLLIPLRVAPVATTIVLFVVFSGVLALPFVAVGMVMATALTRSPWSVGKTYAVDLAGAACGAAAVPLLLAKLDAGSAILSLGALGALGAAFFAWAAPDRRRLRPALGVAAIVAAIAGGNAVVDHGLVPLWVKGKPEDRSMVDIERWNSHARVQVSREVTIPGALWGAGTQCKPPLLRQRLMVIDGDAATPLYYPQGALEDLRFLDCDVTNLVHQVRRGGPMAIIGVGGSRDVQTALLHEHRPVVGIELNGLLLDVLRGPLGQGTLVPRHPDVQLVHDEARSYLTRTSQRFQVIQASLIDTWAATGAGAHALGENGLYTVEAWDMFLDRLEPRGVLTVSRWASGESARLIPLATASLLDRGVDKPRDHVILVSAGRVTTMLVSPSPFDRDDMRAIRDASERFGFQIHLAPEVAASAETGGAWLEANDREALDRATLLPSLDFRPPTDERPFFFNVVRPTAFWQPFPAGVAGNIEGNAAATGALALSFFASLVLSLLAIVLPLALRARPRRRLSASLVGGLAYFGLIGVGFMLCEMGLLQRLSLVLGHPSYSLMVVLASLVGAAGAGSWLSESLPFDRAPWCFVLPLLAAAALLLLAWGLPIIAPAIQGWSTVARIFAAIAICSAVGVVLGMLFPTGMRLVRSRHDEETPWFWGLNGVGSVLASSIAVLIALGWGLRWLFGAAAACYVFVALAVMLIRSRAPGPNEDAAARADNAP